MHENYDTTTRIKVMHPLDALKIKAYRYLVYIPWYENAPQNLGLGLYIVYKIQN